MRKATKQSVVKRCSVPQSHRSGSVFLCSCLTLLPPAPLSILGAAKNSARPEPAFPVVRASAGRRRGGSTALKGSLRYEDNLHERNESSDD